MPRVIFAFGPDQGYLVSSPGRSRWNDLPKTVNWQGGVNVSRFLTCAFGQDDQYFISYENTAGTKVQWCPKLPTKLRTWLYHDGHPVRDLDTLQISLGPKSSFFAMDKKGFCWANLPPGLEARLQESLTPEGWSPAPKIVVLGVDGAYVYIDSKGGLSWDLKSRYEGLDKYLNTEGIGCLIEYISLDAINGTHSFVATRSGGFSYIVPDSWSNFTRGFCHTLPEIKYTPPKSVESLQADYDKLVSENEALQAKHNELSSEAEQLQADNQELAKGSFLLMQRVKEVQESLTGQTGSELVARDQGAATRAISEANEIASRNFALMQRIQAIQ